MRLIGSRPGGEKVLFSSRAVLEIVPCVQPYSSPMLAEPITALVPYQSKLLPIHGPLPSDDEAQNAWIVVFADHGEIVVGVPELTREQNAVLSRAA